jgi:P27 family predicted phage terminase small subunit
MGRHRKPTKMKIEHSILREDRDKINIEGQDLSEIEVPGILDPAAYEIYRDLAVKISDMGLLMEVDCYMLSILANDIYEYGEIVKRLQEPGQEYLQADANGTIRRNPLLLAKNKLSESIQSIGKLYGFTPINRAGLPIEYEQAKQKYESGKGKVSGFKDKWGSI